MPVSIDIPLDIVTWIISHVQLDSLPQKIVEYLILWKTGKEKPTFNQIEKVSKATGIPLGYFFLQKPPEEDVTFVEYRTVNSIEIDQPSRNLIDTMHDMHQIQDWMHNYLVSENMLPLDFIGSQKRQTSYSNFAHAIRKLLNLPVDWYKHTRTAEQSFDFIRNVISDIGVIVMMNGIVGNNTHRQLSITEFRAFSIIDTYAPLIFINSNDSVNGKLFSLLHEFAHICLGENSLFNDQYGIEKVKRKTEVLCNAVAAEILVPQDIFIECWNSSKKDLMQIITELAHMFKCGTAVIARKAYTNQFISHDLYQKIVQQAIQLYNEQKKMHHGNGGNYYRTVKKRIDSRFFRTLINSVHEGKTLYTDAFRLTNTNRSSFAVLAEMYNE